MKRLTWYTVLLLALWAVQTTTTAQTPNPARFKVELAVSGSTVEARCVEGCLWTTTSFRCSPGTDPCRFVMDQNGVEGPKSKAD